MKSSDESFLIPGIATPSVWRSSGKEGMSPVEPGRVRKTDWVALPMKQVISLPARFPAMSADRRDAAAMLELDTLGMNGLTEDEFQVVTYDNDQRDQRAIISVSPSNIDVPPEAGMDSRFAPSVAFRRLRPTELSLWQESGQWCIAVPDENGHALHAQALSAREPDVDAAAEMRCIMGALDLLGLTPDLKQVSIEHPADYPPPLNVQEVANAVDLPLAAQVSDKPKRPQQDWRLTPAPILQKRRERSQRQTAMLAGLAGILVVMALVGAFAARLWTRERALVAETMRIERLEPELATIREAQERWTVIESALTPDKTPSEIFYQVAQLLPTEGIRIAAFRLDGQNIVISGEAQDQGLEGQFRQNLMDSKVPAFDGLIWDTPNSRPQSDGRNTFDWQASPPVTEES